MPTILIKRIAKSYADVPFLDPNSDKLIPKPQHPEEYLYSQDNKTDIEKAMTNQLTNYEDLLKKVAEDGWTNKEGKKVTYPDLVYTEGNQQKFKVTWEQYAFIKENCVHLSANFNSPELKLLDHEDIAYTNIPRFTDKNEYKDPPYERDTYNPELAPYDH